MHDLGLPPGTEQIAFCQGRWDEITRGAGVVKVDGSISSKKKITDLNITYWYRTPHNQTGVRSLLSLKANAKGEITHLSIDRVDVPLNNPDAVRDCLNFASRIISPLKSSEYPDAAKIMAECRLEEAIGKSIPALAGMSPEGGFNFRQSLYFQERAAEGADSLALPQDPMMVEALVGLGTNSFAPQLAMADKNKAEVLTRHTVTRKSYDNSLTVMRRDSGSIKVQASLLPAHAPKNEPVYYPDLMKVFTEKARGGSGGHVLTQLNLAGHDLSTAGHYRQAGALGAINGMASRIAAHDAPVPMEALARYDQTHLILSSPLQIQNPGSGDDFKFRYISRFGNRVLPVIDGFGDGLGACKELSAGGVTLTFDIPYEPSPNGSPRSGAVPRISDDTDAIFITHRHLDHAGGIPFANLPRGVEIHATPEVCEAIRSNYRRAYGSQATSRLAGIKFVPLDQPGFKNYSKDGGKSGETVIYAPNAGCHSAYTTPYYVAAYYTDKQGVKRIKGVMAILGDMRTEDDTDSRGRKLFDPAFFQTGWREWLAKAHPDLSPDEIPERPTFAEFDATSVLHEGYTPRQKEVEKNFKDIVGLFTNLEDRSQSYNVMEAHLSGSDVMWGVTLRSAAYWQRDITAFGANMEQTQTLRNKFGVEASSTPWAKGHQNQIAMDEEYAALIQERIDAHVAAHGEPKIGWDEIWPTYAARYEEHLKMTKEAFFAASERMDPAESKLAEFCREYAAKTKKAAKENNTDEYAALDASRYQAYLEQAWYQGRRKHKHDAEYARLKLTQTIHDRLSEYADNYVRYKRRQEWAAEFGIPHELDLGGIIITRDAKTSAMMFADHPGSMMEVITGTQGTEIEEEAQLRKILENRGLLRGQNPIYRSTARPIDVKRSVLVIGTPAIPGNQEARSKLVADAVKAGLIVFDTTHDGFEIHNFSKIPKAIQDEIKKMARALKLSDKPSPVHNGMMIFPNKPAGYRGHGRHLDLQDSMKIVNAEVSSAQHLSNAEASDKLEIIAQSCAQESRRTIDDHMICEIDRHAVDKVSEVGRIPSAIDILRFESPYQKPFGGVIHRESVVRIEPQGCATHMEPLLAGCEGSVEVKKLFPLNAAETDFKENEKNGNPSFRIPKPHVKPVGADDWVRRSSAASVPIPGQGVPVFELE
ncbi:MAG: hypothetical protein LRY76_03395 [Alphaproteobacteria bacterium]|nr:hypothetical protein [Alphaproteobacteria bacterium]